MAGKPLLQKLGSVGHWEDSAAGCAAGRIERGSGEAAPACRCCSSGEDDVFQQPQEQQQQQQSEEKTDPGQGNVRQKGPRMGRQPRPRPGEKDDEMGEAPEEEETGGELDGGTDKEAEAGLGEVAEREQQQQQQQQPEVGDREGGAEKEEERDLQTDTGWAWVVMIANFAILFLMVGYSRALALFLFEFIDMFQVPTTTVTLSFGLMSAGNGAGNLMVAHTLLPRMEERVVVMAGSFLFGVCVALTSLAPNMTFVIVIHFFLGVSQAMLYIPGLTIMGRYFRRRRSLAMAVANSGVSVSFLVFPSLTQALIAAYGPRGALLLMAGIAAQCLVAGALLRPFRPQGGSRDHGPDHALAKGEGGAAPVAGDEQTKKDDAKSSVEPPVRNGVQFLNGSNNRASKLPLVESGHAESHTQSKTSETAGKGAGDVDVSVSTDDDDTEVSTPFLNAKPETGTPDRNIADLTNDKIKHVNDAGIEGTRTEDCAWTSHADSRPLPGHLEMRVLMALDQDCHVANNHALPKRPNCRCRASSLSEYAYRRGTYDDANPDSNLPTTAAPLRGSGSGNDDRVPKSGRSDTQNGIRDPHKAERAANCCSRTQLPIPRAPRLTAADTALIRRVMETRRMQRFYSCPEPGDAEDGGGEGATSSLTGRKCPKTPAPDAFSGSVIDLCGASLASTLTLFPVDAVSVESLERSATGSKLKSTSGGGRRAGCLGWCRSLVDLSLFSNWLFRLTLAYVPLGMTGGFVGFYFPSLGVSNGLSKDDAAFLLPIMGSLDLCSKLVIGYIADLRVVRTTHLVAGSLLVLGIATQFTRFYTGFGLLAAYAVLTGASGSVCPNLLAVVIIELLGLASLGKAMALVLLFNSAHAFLIHLVVGALADGTGSFSASYNYMGSCLLLSCGLLLLEPVARRLERGRLERLASKGKEPRGGGAETV